MLIYFIDARTGQSLRLLKLLFNYQQTQGARERTFNCFLLFAKCPFSSEACRKLHKLTVVNAELSLGEALKHTPGKAGGAKYKVIKEVATGVLWEGLKIN